MKISLKFYRKLFRLFCLKKQEKAEIEKMFHVELQSRTRAIYQEYVGVFHELTQWQAVARMYRIKNPYELYQAIKYLQPEDYITEAELKAMEIQGAAQFSRRYHEAREDSDNL